MSHPLSSTEGSDPRPAPSPRLRSLASEAIAAAAIVTTIALVMDPADPGMTSLEPHLAWIAVLVLAARYGMEGLLASLAATTLGLALASLCVGQGLGWLAARSQDASEILAFVGAVAVAWVAGAHERRKAALAAENAEQARLAAEAQAGFAEMREIATALGQRADRAEVSISFLRSIATRLESNDPVTGTGAALELALGRLGARAGVVLLHDGTRLRSFAHQGPWSADTAAPPDVFQDRTAQRAFDQVRAVSGWDLDGMTDLDSDLAAPILSDEGKPIGVLALRGVGFEVLVPSAMAELSAIARWTARSLGSLAPETATDDVTTYSITFRPLEAGRRPSGRRARGTIDVTQR